MTTQRGSSHASAKLREEDVTRIRLGEFATDEAAAKEFGVTPYVVYCARRGITWRSLSDPRPQRRSGKRGPNVWRASA